MEHSDVVAKTIIMDVRQYLFKNQPTKIANTTYMVANTLHYTTTLHVSSPSYSQPDKFVFGSLILGKIFNRTNWPKQGR